MTLFYNKYQFIKFSLMSQRILPRFNLPNQRGQKGNCDICNVKFQLLVKKEHQCKRCLRSVCEQCGPQRRNVYDDDGSVSLHRCCHVCIKQIDLINQYKNSHKLWFGQDSQFVSDWVNKLNKQRKTYDDILNQLSDNITGVTNENTIRFKRQSQNLMNQLVDSLNYSFRHFFKIITEDVNKQITQSKIRNVMIAIFAKVKNLPYIPELIYLAVFFLCFANQAHSYFIITRIIEKIFPQYVRVNRMKKDNLLSSSLKTILQMYRVCVDRVDRNQLQIIAQYLQTRFPTYVLSFTLNISSMPVSFFILNQMLSSGSSLPFYKGIASMISFCRQQIGAYKSFSEVQIPILRNVTVQKLRGCFIQFQKSDAKFQISNEVFDSTEHRKLHEKFKQMQSLYDKSQKSLADKEVKIKQILLEMGEKKKIIQQQMEKQKKLQTDLLKLSHLVPKLIKFDQISQKYEKQRERNKVLEQKCSQLYQKIQRIQKEQFSSTNYKKNWVKMQNEYINQIVQLKTKNQIMEIQVLAKQIDFNTSIIDKKIHEKNIQSKMLKQDIKKLKEDLEYYKLKIIEKNYGEKEKKIIKNDNQNEQKKIQGFQKYIENCKELLEGLNKEVQSLKLNIEEKTQKIKWLQKNNRLLQQKIKQDEEISRIIKQIPQQYNYIEYIQKMERVIAKQANCIVKKTLQSIKDSFEKCHKQLKFRTIDCRIKQAKLKNDQQKITNFSNGMQIIKQVAIESNDNFMQVLQQIQNKKQEQNATKQCYVM